MMHIRFRKMLAALLVCMVAAAVHAGTPVKLAPGDPVPDYLGNMRDGTAIHARQFRGKVLLVTFWATWCHYCMKELPILANIQRLAGDRLQVVAVSHDENRRTYMSVHRQLKHLGLMIAYDGSNKAANRFNVQGIPHMVMIGSDGRIAYIHIGYAEDMLPEIARELNTLLAAVPQPDASSKMASQASGR